ncbi:hypothetical protein CSX11_28695 [Mycobacterium goodii]|nr:hypothetical protein CSX11_28695 [Mycolicibacterium goodii]
MSVPPPPQGPTPPPNGFQPPSDSPRGVPYSGYLPQSWPPSPRPPARKRGNGLKWILGVVAILAVVGVTAAVTLAVANRGEQGEPGPGAVNTSSTPSRGNVASDIASANDTGPVGVITEDPTCASEYPIMTAWVNKSKNGWAERDPSIPATAWSPEVRKQHEEVGEALRVAANQLQPLLKVTPHRVVREIYEQFIAYGRAYADSIPTYTPPADYLARVAVNASDAIANICSAVNFGSAAARGPLVSKLPAPSDFAAPNIDDPQRFMKSSDPVCGEWNEVLQGLDRDTTAWRATDPSVPSTEWTPEEKALNEEVIPIMRRVANQMLALGNRSQNSVLKDLADLSVQYRNAFIAAIPTYMPADNYLSLASLRVAGIVNSACRAAA